MGPSPVRCEEDNNRGISHPTSCPRLLSLVVLQIGNPTIIVNNAGVLQGKLILDLSPEDIQQYGLSFFFKFLFESVTILRTFGVNLLAHYWILKAFLPAMIKEQTGHIVSRLHTTAEYLTK